MLLLDNMLQDVLNFVRLVYREEMCAHAVYVFILT